MIAPDPAFLEERRRGYRRRAVPGVAAIALMVASVVLPHVMVEAATVVPGRSLIAASNFFLNASPRAEGFAGAVSVSAAGFGISVTYVGLALQQAGLIFGVMSFWVLIAEDVGRWVRRMVMVSGALLVLGAATVVLGYQLLNGANVPTLLGIAWLPTLLAGLIMLIGGRLARRRLVSTWYWDKPELVQP